MLPTQKLAMRPQKMSGCCEISSGPGVIPWIARAASRRAMTASQGMPRLMVGMQSPRTAECVAVSGAATPSIAPRPKRSGVRDTLFSTA